MSELNSARVSGSGVIGGGEYDKIKISGSGKVTGDISCNEFSISGAASVNGSVCGERVSVSGSCKFKGGIEAREVKISGSSVIGNTLKGEKVRISGGVNIDGDCEAEEIRISGAVKINGLLNAGVIEINLGGNSSAREIGGEVIHIKHENRRGGIISEIFKKLAKGNGEFNTEIIEGDEIFIENTVSKVVRGKDIEIGKGCLIDTVEYSGILEIHEEAQVREIIKL